MHEISNNCDIHKTASIGKNVSIGPFTVIGPNVVIGDDTCIGSHVVIKENTTIGKNNKIHQFASLGGDPQVRDYVNSGSYLEIGDNNTFHEYVTINRGDVSGKKLTIIGNNNLFMTCSHVGHDCVIRNNVILVNNSGLGGHVEVDDYATIGAHTVIHQFCKIGNHSFLSRFAFIAQDVLPFSMVVGSPAKVIGINKVGLERRGFTKDQVKDALRCNKIIFRQNLTTLDAIAKMKEEISSKDIVDCYTSALESSERGITR